MKKAFQIKRCLALLLFVFNLDLIAQQTCEPNYSIVYFNNEEATSTIKASGNKYNLSLSIGQPFTTTATNYSKNSMVMGFWGRYLMEPRPPILRATDGDFQDMVLVQWTVEDDDTGPPVSGTQVKIYRNGYVLATLPIEQTDYMDLNVFPGQYYTYGVTTTNDMGESHTDDNIGFINPNGVITGNIKTPSGNPVLDTKVLLTPNLGRSAFFDGSSYIYFFDAATSANRLFDGLEGNYTIETWFRSIENKQQIIFSAVDSATADEYVSIELTEEGKVRWQHNSKAGESGASIVTVNSYTGTGADWHHLSVVFDKNDMMMYVDGAIVGHNTAEGPINDNAEIIIGKRSPLTNSLYFNGRLDDFRIWKEARSWADIRKYMDITLSGEEWNLAAYWKFDEVRGDIIFDLTENSIDGNICGIERDEFKAPVFVGALTDSVGNYAIKGVYYAGGTTFTVTPSKVTSIGRSLKFNGADNYIEFKNRRIDLGDDYTLEGWFKTASTINQTIFSAVNPADGSARMSVELTSSGNIKFSQFASSVNSGNSFNDELWHHYAVTRENSTLKLYVDGKLEGSNSSSTAIQGLSEFVIGRKAPDKDSDYFNGYLDEFRVWDYARTFDQIGGTMNQTLEGDEFGLINYWRFNEGSDNIANDDIDNNAPGRIVGAEWSSDIPLNEIFVHIYEPESRQATLNNSNTSVDRVDFTDISLIPISGYVKYENTSCMIPKAMMLLNGKSFIPPVYTDENGKFTVEIEPGKSGALLSVSFEDHAFVPTLMELPIISRPITALYFNDKQTYNVNGKVVGGVCEFPITPSQGEIKVNFSSVNGCYDTTIVPDLNTGMFEIKDLPPLIYSVTIDHPDPEIDGFFTGDTLSLTDSDREINFVYRSKPEVSITGFPTNTFGMRVMDMLKDYSLDVNIFEKYINYATKDTNTCAVESGSVKINNFISDENPDTTYQFTNGIFKYSFKAGKPNILGGGQHPYRKNIQATITDSLERTVSKEEWTIVTGNRPRETFYATTTPEVPLMILHAPPGDGSSAYWSSGTTVEQSIGFSMADASTEGAFINTHLGVDITTSVGFGATVDFTTDVTTDISTSSSVTMSNNTYEEQTWSYSTKETISTVFEFGDLFIGGAINLLYGITDVLRLDGQNVVIEAKPIVVPNGFATNYIYSEKHINDVVIPSLYTIGDTTSAKMWKDYLAKNQANKSAASFKENRSFDAGTVYSFEHTAKVTKTTGWEFEMEVDDNFASDAGIEINGVGVTGGANISTILTTGKSGSDLKTTTNTFGYTFADDDPGNAFTVDVLTDETYGSPVFKTVSGASSCPWEPGTVPFDGPSLNVSPALQSNVSPGEAAVFNLTIGNTSQMDADREYWLRVINSSNPNGAEIYISGVPIEDHASFFIPAGQSVNAVMTVYRGPDEYEYNNIQLQLVSPCEYERWSNGFDLQLADTISFSVDYRVPCSEINIAVPEEGWLITGSDASDTLWITLNDYDRNSQFLEKVELRYRTSAIVSTKKSFPDNSEKSTGAGKDTLNYPAGDWFVAASVPASELIDDYVLVPWNINSKIVVDGTYELQGVAICSGDKVPGKSQIVTGIIDRESPKLLGAQSPSDGILDPDDEIQIFFNEDIECANINPGAGDIKLFNTVTGEAVDFSFTCGGNTIIIEPGVQNYFIENQSLRAEVKNISDKYGNKSPKTFSWEFFVNRNPIVWSGGGINDVVINIDESFTTTKQLVNTGGSNRSFTIIGGREGATAESPALPIPSWLVVEPKEGIITPGNELTITISLSEATNFGEFQTILYAAGVLGDEPMPVDIRKLCYPPDWKFDPFGYQYTMTITGELAVESDLSMDKYDIVAAFIDGELRGIANVQYVPALDGLPNTHPYRVFLNVYSNNSSGDKIQFKVWDASECKVLGMIAEDYTFESVEILGTPTTPVPITATNQILSRYHFPAGWKWFSLNIESNDMSVNTLFESLNPLRGDILKSQAPYSQYANNYGWVGPLNKLGTKSMYMIRLSKADTLELVAYPVDVETDTIDVVKGWNWIGFTPQQSIEVNKALASLERATTGDLIKSQLKYAQFVEGLGWIGSLDFMDPKLGYLMYSNNPGKLLYPFWLNQNGAGALAKSGSDSDQEINSPWKTESLNAQYNMTFTAVVEIDGIETDTTGDVLAAFTGEAMSSDSSWKCIGIASAKYLPKLNRHIFFLMVNNENAEEEIHLRYYNSRKDAVYHVPGNFKFTANSINGTVTDPIALEARPIAIGDPGYLPTEFILSNNYPNPFNPSTKIGYGLPTAAHVEITIYSILGQKVRTLVSKTQEAGYRFALWDGRNDYGQTVSAGIYIYAMRTKQFKSVKKMILIK